MGLPLELAKVSETPAMAENAPGEKIPDHDKAAPGGQEPRLPQSETRRIPVLNSEDFPPLDFSKLELYRPGEGLDDFVVEEGSEEAIYYGEEE
jgi:hypothetical protein